MSKGQATQEFKVLSTLLYSKDYVATHLELYKAIHPNAERISKTQRDQLSQIIRNIKRKLMVLPPTMRLPL